MSRVMRSLAALLVPVVLSAACGPGSSPEARPVPLPYGSVARAAGSVARAAAKLPPPMPTGPKARFEVARRTSAGPILVTRLRGERSGVTGKVWVWLPPQYHQRRYAHTGFPVITLYTGGSGAGYNYWSDPKILPTQAEDLRLVRQGRAHPFIMVMPVLQPSVREDTECSDIPGYPRMGTWLADDVPAFVRANFRTLIGPDGWGTAGASSGALCAVKMAADRPGTYRAAVSWGGYFTPYTNLPWSEEGRLANSPYQVIRRTRPDIRLLLLAGGNPRIRVDVREMTALTKVIRPPTVATAYVQPGGLHRTQDLRPLIPMILEFLSNNLSGPFPAPGRR
jgi:hypothetical protein